MKSSIISLLLVVLMFSCQKKEEALVQLDSNKNFEKYKESFVLGLWELYPDWAANQGYHKLDSVLVILDSRNKKKQRDFAHAQLDSLQHYPLENLSDSNIIDFYMIQNQLKSSIFSIDKLKSYQWNPAEYNVSGAFAEILNGKYDSLEVRLHSFNMKMDT